LGTLTIAGHGPLQREVESFAAQRPDVRFVGQLEQPAMAAAIRAAAVVIVPSTCPEAFPRIVVEALSHGRPVVATALGGLPGIVTQDVGVLVEPNIDSVAAGLARIPALDEPGIRKRARERYEQLYSPNVVYSQLLQIYDDILAEKPIAARGNR
jgi:glycosyltransferase involved in cell wall biosynthesis